MLFVHLGMLHRPFFLICLIASFRTIRWSTVALPVIPPPWASVICTSFLILSLRILSYTLPKLLASVIPLSLLHFPLAPFPLYSLFISPSNQLFGMFSLLWISSIILHSMFLVSGSASMKISLGMPSGPKLFFLLSFFIASFISLLVIGSWSGPGFFVQQLCFFHSCYYILSWFLIFWGSRSCLV